jgi:hypothetical protein
MRDVYVRLARATAAPLEALLPLVDTREKGGWSRYGDTPWRLWLRSLPQIYDVDGLAALDLPWWTMRSARIVAAYLLDQPDGRVFEYGSGASTLWLTRRCRHVESVEHDAEWFSVIDRRAAELENVSLRLVEPLPASEVRTPSGRVGHEDLDFTDYAQSIQHGGQRYSLIVIDGRARVECLKVARQALADPGVIVFDNTGRQRYHEGLRAVDLPSITTRGLTPCLPYPERTTLFFSDPDTRRRVLAAAGLNAS